MISSHGRRVKICVCCPVISTLLSSAVLGWGLGLCASVEVCVQISLCWCWWQSEGVRSCSSMIGADPSSESGLGLGDVDFDAVGAFCGGVLSHWRRSLRCHQSFPGFLPLLVHSRVHAPVLPRRKPGLWRLLWHGWWKLLVFVLRTRQKRYNTVFILQIEIVVILNMWKEIIAQHMDSSCTLKWGQIFVMIHLKINLSYMDLKLSRWELTKQK